MDQKPHNAGAPREDSQANPAEEQFNQPNQTDDGNMAHENTVHSAQWDAAREMVRISPHD